MFHAEGERTCHACGSGCTPRHCCTIPSVCHFRIVPTTTMKHHYVRTMTMVMRRASLTQPRQRAKQVAGASAFVRTRRGTCRVSRPRPHAIVFVARPCCSRDQASCATCGTLSACGCCRLTAFNCLMSAFFLHVQVSIACLSGPSQESRQRVDTSCASCWSQNGLLFCLSFSFSVLLAPPAVSTICTRPAS